MNAVELTHVSKAFRDTLAVDDLSLSVPQGAIYGFIGPNGSGKTTTLRMILHILRPDRGSIRVFESERRSAVSGRVGYLPEERGLYKRMRVRPMLRFYGELKSGRGVDREVEQWLQRLDLIEHADKKIEALSKGSAQRVQFIAAVLASPELVILDEPFSGLDPVHADILRTAILDLRRQGTTVILSTHDMELAEQMCDFIFMIFRGRKVLDGTLAGIKSLYGTDTVRVRTSIEATVLASLPGVESVRDFGQRRELKLQPGADAQGVLQSLIAAGRVESFEVAQPSLHDIFVRIAGCYAPR
jgi:ABC-2 type transport system ATP-binding protein